MANPSRTNTFNYFSEYRQVIPIAGRVDQDWMYPEMQQENFFTNWDTRDQILNQGAILSGLTTASLDSTSGAVSINGGFIYFYGIAVGVNPATLNYGTTIA